MKKKKTLTKNQAINVIKKIPNNTLEEIAFTALLLTDAEFADAYMKKHNLTPPKKGMTKKEFLRFINQPRKKLPKKR